MLAANPFGHGDGKSEASCWLSNSTISSVGLCHSHLGSGASVGLKEVFSASPPTHCIHSSTHPPTHCAFKHVPSEVYKGWLPNTYTHSFCEIMFSISRDLTLFFWGGGETFSISLSLPPSPSPLSLSPSLRSISLCASSWRYVKVFFASTARGFEPLRAEPNGFRVHHLNHSVTLSWKNVMPVDVK